MENHRKVPLAVAIIAMLAAAPASARNACRTTPVYQVLFDGVQKPLAGRLVLEVALQGPPSPGFREARVVKVVRGRYRKSTVLLQPPACGSLDARRSGQVMGRLVRSPSGAEVLAPFAVKTNIGWAASPEPLAERRAIKVARRSVAKAKPARPVKRAA